MRIIYALLLILFCMAQPALSQTIEITSIETWVAGAYEYINIKTTGWDPPTPTYDSGQHKLILSFRDARISFLSSFTPTIESRIDNILTVSIDTDPPSAEVVINFKKDIRYDIANMMGRNMSMIEIRDAAPVVEKGAEEGEKEVKEEIAPLEVGVEVAPDVPAFARAGKFKIILAGNEFKTSGVNIFSGGQYMVPAKDFFQAIDSQVIEKRDGSLYIMRGDRQKVEVFPQSNKVKVDGRELVLDVAPKLVKKFRRAVLYVPLVSIAKIIDYGVIWDERGKALVIDPILKNITLSGSGSSSRVDISFSDPVDDNNLSVASSAKLVTVEVRDIIVSGDKKGIISGEADMIRKIHISQVSSRKILITIALSNDSRFREASLDNGSIYSLIFSPAITSIKPQKGPGSTRIEIDADSPVTFEVSEAKNPNRIILDIPGAILSAPARISLTQSSKEAIGGVAASQYKLDPPVVRVAISLREASKFLIVTSEDGKKISVSVADLKVAKKPAAPKKYNILKNKVIIVDAGHGGRDPGAIGYSRTYEKDAALLLAIKISQALEAAGATVFLTRDGDTTTDMREITRFANSNRADIFIAVHYNSFPWLQVSGTETYYYTPQSRLLARIIHKNLVNGIHRKNRGVKRVMYYTIHHTVMPSVLIEPGYLTHPKEEKLAFSPAFQKEVSSDILKGVVEYFNAVGKMRRGKI